MKNYPLLTIDNHSWFYNWRKTHITYLLNQVRGLYNYNYFIIPPFRQISFIEQYSTTQTYKKGDLIYRSEAGQEKVYKYIYSEPTTGEWNENYWEEQQEDEITNLITDNILHYNKIPTHGYIQLTTEVRPEGYTDLKLPSGTWVISNALNEGAEDIVNNFNYYNYLPGGYGSFYAPTSITQSNINNNTFLITWIYKENAGEIFGYEPGFNFILSSNRFILLNNNQPNRHKLNSRGYEVYSEKLGTYISQDNNLIFQQWYTLGTPMHFFFTDNSTYGEEIILDEIHTVNLNFGNTHSYDISSKQGDISSFYIDFI